MILEGAVDPRLFLFSDIMKDYPLLIGGKKVATANRLNVLDPYDISIVGKTYLAGKAELEKAITIAQGAQDALWKLPTHVRGT